MQRKNITVRDEHEEFITDMNIKLSGILQDILDEMIEQYGWKPVDEIVKEKDDLEQYELG